MAPALKKDSRILIIGGGTFGTSTAYYLARRGYNSVTVLDRLPPPSEIAAGNDINKVIRADYPDSLYANLASESIQVWRDPDSLFGHLYHRCGLLLAAPEKGSSLDFIRGSAKVAAEKGFEPAKQVSAGEVRQRWPAYCGAMEGWQIYWNSSAGWANARLASQRMAEAAKAIGVGYIVGDSGFVTNILYDESGHAIGAESADGTFHKADLVIVAAGAAAASILNLEGQLVAKGHTVGHIQLTPSEIEKYKSLPIVDHFEGGIIFPPQEDGIIKIGAVHFVPNCDPASHPNISLPRYRCDNKADGIPKPIESHLRSWLRQLAPELADRPWFETRICWDADSPDFHFLISPHPKHGGLQMAVGGSAHGFKFMPVIGNYVVDSLEGRLDAGTARKWRWRPNAPATPSPHPAPLLDLNSLSKRRRSKAKL